MLPPTGPYEYHTDYDANDANRQEKCEEHGYIYANGDDEQAPGCAGDPCCKPGKIMIRPEKINRLQFVAY